MEYRTGLHVRWMIGRDRAEVLALIPGLTEEQALSWLRCRNVIGMVCECGEVVVGAMVYELHPDRLEVMAMGCEDVDVEAALVGKLLSKLASHRRVEVRMVTEDYGVCGRLARHGFVGVPCGDEVVMSYLLPGEWVRDELCEEVV